MKRIYKLVSITAVLVILLTALFAFPASAANVNYSVTSASGAKGDTVTVYVKVSSSVGVMGAKVYVNYDSSKLQYAGGSAGDMFEIKSVPQQSGSSVSCTGMNNSDSSAKKSGTLAILKFKILASSGEAALTIVPDKAGGNHVTVGGGRLTPVSSNGKITVTVPVSGVSLNKTSVSLKKNETAQLTATVAPSNATNKAVTYSSSNNKVATVNNNGKITAVSGGTATITAKAGGKTATCKVTVTVPQTGIKVSGNAQRSVGVGSTLRLTTVKVPADATDNYSVTWTSADNSIATVSANGTVTGVALGETTVTAKSNGWTAVYKIKVVEKTEEAPSELSETESTTLPEETTPPEETEPTTDATEPAEESTTKAQASAGTIEKFRKRVSDFINDEEHKVSRFYHYCMVIGVAVVTAAISIPVTFFVTASYYEKKKKNQDNER